MVLMTIIANCIVLALEEHLPEGDKTPLAVDLVRLMFHFIVSNFINQRHTRDFSVGGVCVEGRIKLEA